MSSLSSLIWSPPPLLSSVIVSKNGRDREGWEKKPAVAKVWLQEALTVCTVLFGLPGFVCISSLFLCRWCASWENWILRWTTGCRWLDDEWGRDLSQTQSVFKCHFMHPGSLHLECLQWIHLTDIVYQSWISLALPFSLLCFLFCFDSVLTCRS